MNANVKAYTTTIVSVCICIMVAIASAQRGLIIDEYPLLFICLFSTFIIQWVVFLPSFYWHTEKFYDLTGSATYIFITLVALYHKAQFIGPRADIRSLLLAVIIIIWALRLGSFLFIRILKDKEDRRFNEWKFSFPLFLRTWTLQGMWIFLTSVAAITAISTRKIVAPDLLLFIGVFLWLFGFLFETISDFQKRKFKLNNKDGFITSGLWSVSRHPNYFGEIVLWLGVAIIAYPTLYGWQYVSLVSPLFVYLLLTRVSGIPLLEEHAEKKWGKAKEYISYKENTPELFPRILK